MKNYKTIYFYVTNKPIILPRVLFSNYIVRLVVVLEDPETSDNVRVLPWSIVDGAFAKGIRKIPSNTQIEYMIDKLKSLPDNGSKRRDAGIILKKDSPVIKEIQETGRCFEVKLSSETYYKLLGFYNFEESEPLLKDPNKDKEPIDMKNDPYGLTKRKA